MWAADLDRSVVSTDEVAFEAGYRDGASKYVEVGTHAIRPVTSSSSAPVYGSAVADANAEEPQWLLNLSLPSMDALQTGFGEFASRHDVLLACEMHARIYRGDTEDYGDLRVTLRRYRGRPKVRTGNSLHLEVQDVGRDQRTKFGCGYARPRARAFATRARGNALSRI
jgi:hypothetical protein